MSEPIETIETDKGIMKIYPDMDPVNPRKEFDHLGEIFHWHRKYDLGTLVDSSDEDAIPKGVRLPVFMYEHGGITLSCGGFSDPFDSGQVGWIVASTEKICEEYKCKKITPTIRKKVAAILKSEIEEFARYLEGNVYGYVLGDDSCWGFIGHLSDVKADMLGQAGAKEGPWKERQRFEAMSQEELDELVLQRKEGEASDLNNAGRTAQIRYLLGE